MGLSDSWLETGGGWGATMMNGIPVIRIDRIWLGEGLQPTGSHARKTEHSDHRMVVTEFRLK